MEFTVDSINFRELGTEFEKAFTDGGELNFDKSSLHFNVYKEKFLSSLATFRRGWQ